MFRFTSKVKLAAGIAAGALTLGAAGAYAAANSNNTVSVTGATPVTVTGGTGTPPTLISLSGKTATTVDASAFKNPGDCVSTFAKNRDLALQPAPGTTRISKNYHGKLVAAAVAWCKQFKPTASTSTKTTDSADAAQSSAPSTDSTDTQSGALHGNGHANGHSRHARQTD
jgi:hypothetical protein